MAVLAFDAERRGESAAAYGRIKERIIRCALAPGTRVTEAQLAAELGLGKTPVREALQRLRTDGFVRVVPRHGYQIVPITLRDVQDIFTLRLILEAAAARLAAGHVDAAQLRRLDELCHAGYTPGDRESEAAFLRANSELHATVAWATGNRQLAEMMVTLLSRMERLFHVGLALRNRTDEMAHEHRDLVDALVIGDGAEAERIMAEQLRASQRMVTAALLSSPELLSVNVAPGPEAGRPGGQKRRARSPGISIRRPRFEASAGDGTNGKEDDDERRAPGCGGQPVGAAGGVGRRGGGRRSGDAAARRLTAPLHQPR